MSEDVAPAMAAAAAPPMTLQQAIDHLVANEPAFALTEITLNGVRYKAFRNCPDTVAALLSQSRGAQDNGAADYLVYGVERWTFDAFTDEVDRVAEALQSQCGLAPGDRVAIAMRNYPEMLVLTLAAASIGAVVVFMNAWWTATELDYALHDSGPAVVFADGPRRAAIASLPQHARRTLVGVRDGEEGAAMTYSDLRDQGRAGGLRAVTLGPDDDFAIMYSSGTTGSPKGVVQTHRAAISAVYSWLMQAALAPLVAPPGPDDPPVLRPSALVTTPLFHVTALYPLFLLSLPAGAKIILMHKWDANDAIRVIKQEQVTRFLGVPTQSADLLEALETSGQDLPSLRFMGAGGAKRPAAQVASLAARFPRAVVATGWGMTETCALGIGMGGEDYILRPDAAGRLHPPVQELRITDDDGNEVPTGEIGEITVKSPAVMRCYLNQPDATAETLRDGWLLTGDLGCIDAEGFVTILDRKKNIIIRGGENIACLDVEGALHRHPDVIEACAFAVPDDRLGEVVGAALHLRAGAHLTASQIAEFLQGTVAHYKIPEKIWCQHDALPRASTEKTDRRAIRARCLGLNT
ncbi:class I adenylate-forming enzyme family protein [Lacimonas salitolerans]|uniref:Class I adenylate-forming enzyme family protein n=1 Tax=Lacimonas salitolerans TaxID=1323750 RepID=A0ABW4EG44_9RHOB